jgi:hypothetical protein
MSDPYYKRAVHSPLFPDVHLVDDRDKAKAFIGRFQKADDGLVYQQYMVDYAGGNGSYDINNKMLENMYRKYYISGLWETMKFIKITFWILEHHYDINTFSYDKVGRIYDRGRLSNGKLEDMDYDTIMWIITGEDEA